jgi:hypothetical protein
LGNLGRTSPQIFADERRLEKPAANEREHANQLENDSHNAVQPRLSVPELLNYQITQLPNYPILPDLRSSAKICGYVV